MPSVRSIILLASFFLIASLIGAGFSLLSPPDSDGQGRDSFGTRGRGYRALHDTLSECGVPVTRQLHPPRPDSSQATLVFLQPDPSLTGAEPVYLKSLLSWVDHGGRLVVAASQLRPIRTEFDPRPVDPDKPTILDSLGLGHIEVKSQLNVGDLSPTRHRNRNDDDDSFESFFPEEWSKRDVEPQEVDVHATGTLVNNQWPVHRLAIPGDVTGTLIVGDTVPQGTLQARLGSDEEDSILAAEFARGAGSIVLVAEPELFNNRLLARADNSIFAAQICSTGGGPVLIDEFYHGLSVRGNPLYLLTQPGYLAITLGLLAMAALTIWREAIFLGPPLPDVIPSRRDVGEYLAAMAQFYSRGRGTRPFLVQQLRDGVLRELCEELSLPAETRDVELVGGALARSNPGRSTETMRTFREVDARLAGRDRWSEAQTLNAMRRLTACLSTKM